KGRKVTASRELAALHQAVLALSGDVELDRVLQTILKTAQRLARARYGALGIPDGHGGFGTFLTVGISEARAGQIGTLPRAHGVIAITSARLRTEAQQLAVLQERNRLARELHDALAQTLFSMTYEAKAAALRAGTDAAGAAAALTSLQAQAERAMAEVGDLV